MTDKTAALDLIRQAIEEDQKKSYAQAYRLYKSAIDTMIRALKCRR
jgi:hypothetical protein